MFFVEKPIYPIPPSWLCMSSKSISWIFTFGLLPFISLHTWKFRCHKGSLWFLLFIVKLAAYTSSHHHNPFPEMGQIILQRGRRHDALKCVKTVVVWFSNFLLEGGGGDFFRSMAPPHLTTAFPWLLGPISQTSAVATIITHLLESSLIAIVIVCYLKR